MRYINLKCKYQSCYLRANLLHCKRQTVAWLKTRVGGLHVCRVPRPLQQFTNLWQLSKSFSFIQGDISTTWHTHIHGLNIMTYTGCPKKITLLETLKNKSKGLASYCKAETTFTFHLSNLTLSNASLGINNREIKNESGISFPIASQPFRFPNTLDCL